MMASNFKLIAIREVSGREEEAVHSSEADSPKDSGQERLRSLGYKQELRRSFGVFASFATGLVLMGNCGSITGFLSIAYLNGGPVSATWGWIGVTIISILMALSIAEIVSAYPIAGGPYFWVLELTKNDPDWILTAWITGWLNVLGQFGYTAGNGAMLANHIANMWWLGNEHVFSPMELLLAYAICLVAAACFGSTTTEGARWFTMVAAAFLIASNVAIVVLLPAVAPVHQPAAYVFTKFYDVEDNSNGIPSNAYLFLLGTLMAQFTYMGYEAPAQFAEETKRADIVAPWAIVWSVLGTAVLGSSFLFTLLFCVQDETLAGLLDEEAKGYAVGQIFYDIFMARFEDTRGVIALMAIPLVAMFSAVVVSLFSNARTLWAFSRDGGVPLYRVWSRINPRTRTPTNAIWAMTALAFLLGLPMLSSDMAFQAIGSFATLGLYLSYGIPIALRIWKADNFQPGPFSLGIWRLPINLLALAWVVVCAVVLALPTALPITWENVNWTPISIGVVMLVALFAWYLPVWGARHWYHGKAHTLAAVPADGGGGGQGIISRPSEDGSAPQRLTVQNLLDDWKPQEAVRKVRKARFSFSRDRFSHDRAFRPSISREGPSPSGGPAPLVFGGIPSSTTIAPNP